VTRATTLPGTFKSTTTAVPVEITEAECFDCGGYGPTEHWEADHGCAVQLCVDREECRRRQFGYCDECLGLGRRYWGCRHPGVAAWLRFCDEGGPNPDDVPSCPTCDDPGCSYCQPYRREADRPYDY
jgi:hypothetical protein